MSAEYIDTPRDAIYWRHTARDIRQAPAGYELEGWELDGAPIYYPASALPVLFADSDPPAAENDRVSLVHPTRPTYWEWALLFEGPG